MNRALIRAHFDACAKNVILKLDALVSRPSDCPINRRELRYPHETLYATGNLFVAMGWDREDYVRYEAILDALGCFSLAMNRKKDRRVILIQARAYLSNRLLVVRD